MEWYEILESIVGIILIGLGVVRITNIYDISILNGIITTIGLYIISALGLLIILIDIPQLFSGMAFGRTLFMIIIGLLFTSLITIKILNGQNVIEFNLPEVTDKILNILFIIEGIVLLVNPWINEF